ncbi:MAG: NAD(P)/FAD-dependent oxidoreductase [Acidobacteria bacterium]|nr:MAG: NAD(P)/FAD-dependent oxidoreductase [Acidobacteriota bacterium]
MGMTDYDVVVVGARCAGATLATYLARSGASVLLLDKDKQPSDQVVSTHTIHPPGIDVLDEIGVGEAVRQRSPATPTVRLRKNGAAVDFNFQDGRAEYCPRRQRLDGLLQEAAVRAGATFLDRTRVTGLLWDKDRVVGVQAVERGQERIFPTALVVGADGRRSTVADLVAAAEYLAYDAPRAMYWRYWETPGFWNTDSAYSSGMYIGRVGEDIRVVFQTDDNQLLIGSMPPMSRISFWRSEPLERLTHDLVEDPFIRPLIEESRPEGHVRGTVRERYFFRNAAGPGWVLCGDAGHHKDFVIGDGITEALLQAKTLAPAICSGLERSLYRWWRDRDVRALPLFFFAQDEARPGPIPDLVSLAFSHAAREPELKARLARVLEHQLSPYEVFTPGNVFRWALAGALRGRARLLSDFFQMGRRVSEVNRELRARKMLAAKERG